MNLRQFAKLPGKTKDFFPQPIWTGDGTTWEVFKRTCPPSSAARKVLTSMTNNVVHLADVIHVAYSGTVVRFGKKKSDKVVDTVREMDSVELQVNPHRRSRRKRSLARRQPVSPLADPVFDAEETDFISPMLARQQPPQPGVPTKDAYLNTPDFRFNNNVTSLSHETLCNDPYAHETQGQFCSDFRNLDSLYPVFSPSSMPGFSDVVIPSRASGRRTTEKQAELHFMQTTTQLRDLNITSRLI